MKFAFFSRLQIVWFLFHFNPKLAFRLTLIHDNVGELGSAQDIIDANDTLLVGVFRVANQSGARLHPGVASGFVQDAIVIAHDLAFVQH